MLQTAETFIRVELGSFEAYLPTYEELAAITAPVQILVSEHGRARSTEPRAASPIGSA